MYNSRNLFTKLETLSTRLSEIADTVEREGRDFTEAELAEKAQLSRDLGIVKARIEASKVVCDFKRENSAEANRQLRETIKNGQRFELRISREEFGGNISSYGDSTVDNPSPVTLGEIVKPLWDRLVLSAIGSPLLTGLKGNYHWPVVETFEASINGEAVSLGDSKIPISKLVAKPDRVSIAVPITREAINETAGLIEQICRENAPNALASLVNKVMFSTGKVDNAVNLAGPFVSANMKSGHRLTYSSDVPTYSDILSLKGKVLGANVMPEGLCYVMTETTKAQLEGTPKWDNAGEPIVKDDKIAGVPVFTTSYATEGSVYFGAFKYAPQGIFGDVTLIVDPYTQARQNSIVYVLNVDYALTVLRPEAFAILSKA